MLPRVNSEEFVSLFGILSFFHLGSPGRGVMLDSAGVHYLLSWVDGGLGVTRPVFYPRAFPFPFILVKACVSSLVFTQTN